MGAHSPAGRRRTTQSSAASRLPVDNTPEILSDLPSTLGSLLKRRFQKGLLITTVCVRSWASLAVNTRPNIGLTRSRRKKFGVTNCALACSAPPSPASGVGSVKLVKGMSSKTWFCFLQSAASAIGGCSSEFAPAGFALPDRLESVGLLVGQGAIE